MDSRDRKGTTARDSLVRFSLGRDGTRLIWILLPTVLAIGLFLDVFTDCGNRNLAFTRAAALLTSIFVPWFAYMFGILTSWRGRLYADEARIEAKELFHSVLLVFAKSKGLEDDGRIDEVLKLSDHKEDFDSTKPTVALMEKASMRAHAVALFIVTFVWGFGDLIAKLIRQVVVE